MTVMRFAVQVLSASLLLAAAAVHAQDYPNKPVRIFVGTAGGGNDFMVRIIAPAISGPLGQPVVIENRPSNTLGELVSKAPADGYTLIVQGSSLWIQTMLQKMNYDVMRDFTAITAISRDVNIVSVHPSLPVKSIKELLALAKARPGALNYASANTGSPSFLASELFKSMAGIDIVAIPYQGTPQAITGAISGEVQMTILDSGITTPYVKSGKLRAIAVTSAQPSVMAPGLPTVAASGVPGYEAVNTTVVFAPAKTPAAIITRLNQEIVRVVNSPDVKEKFLTYGTEPITNSPDEIAAIVKADIARTAKTIKDAGIKVN